MRIWLIALGIGLAAGVIDIIPMILQKLDRRATIAAFLQYFFVGAIITLISLPGIVWWAQGSIIALALALPTMVIVSGPDRKALPVIATMAVVLGALIGVAAHFLR